MASTTIISNQDFYVLRQIQATRKYFYRLLSISKEWQRRAGRKAADTESLRKRDLKRLNDLQKEFIDICVKMNVTDPQSGKILLDTEDVGSQQNINDLNNMINAFALWEYDPKTRTQPIQGDDAKKISAPPNAGYFLSYIRTTEAQIKELQKVESESAKNSIYIDKIKERFGSPVDFSTSGEDQSIVELAESLGFSIEPTKKPSGFITFSNYVKRKFTGETPLISQQYLEDNNWDGTVAGKILLAKQREFFEKVRKTYNNLPPCSGTITQDGHSASVAENQNNDAAKNAGTQAQEEERKKRTQEAASGD